MGAREDRTIALAKALARWMEGNPERQVFKGELECSRSGAWFAEGPTEPVWHHYIGLAQAALNFIAKENNPQT